MQKIHRLIEPDCRFDVLDPHSLKEITLSIITVGQQLHRQPSVGRCCSTTAWRVAISNTQTIQTEARIAS